MRRRGFSVADPVPWIALAAALHACGGTTGTNHPSGGGGTGQAGSNGTGLFWGDPATGGAPAAISVGCKLDSDCNVPLVCAFGRCHLECESSRSCAANRRCVRQSPDPRLNVSVCLVPEETRCHYNTDCPNPLVCAVDLQCRNQCAADRDCSTGQVCSSGVCADVSELNPDGMLVATTDGGL